MTIHGFLIIITVSYKGVGECVDPEGNGVNPGEGDGGGPSPPSEEQDKQLISNNWARPLRTPCKAPFKR
jgi:hypothetical protein